MKQRAGRRPVMAARPLGPRAVALGALVSRAWSLPPRRNRVAVERGLAVPMSDGTVLLADHYLPVSVAAAATVLVRCPYGRSGPFALQNAQLLAERGYHVLLQSVRGTFGSGGEFEPMRREITDGQDTVAWLRRQPWFGGSLATFGASYLGFVQWALAMDPPPELVAAVVHVGPHDFSRSAFRNGVFDLYNYVAWSDLVLNQENTGLARTVVRSATADRRLRPVLGRLPVADGFRDLLGRELTGAERWLEHPDPADPFWAPVQCAAALDRITVPVLVVGGWHDLFIEQTLEQYRALSGRGVPARLLVGPWTHLEIGSQGGAAMTESLAWLDRYAGPGRTGPRAAAGPETRESAAVRIWVGGEGAGEWRETGTWPPPAAVQRWYLGANGSLGLAATGPGGAGGPGVPAARFRYDPADPTPSPGGATLSVHAGSRDQRAVERRPDVLVFSSDPLGEPAEVIGEVAAELSVTRDNPDADLFARLCDVDPRGRSRNVCDGIVRLTSADPLTGIVRVSLLGAAHRFGRGHRIRLQVAGGAFPRFARNPGTGQVDAPASGLVPTRYEIGLDAARPSVLLLPVAPGS
ncbi:MAG TPA: CocE/NonD family hydrolase [Streptosporangiaceae bacterium]